MSFYRDRIGAVSMAAGRAWRRAFWSPCAPAADFHSFKRVQPIQLRALGKPATSTEDVPATSRGYLLL